MNFQHLPKPRLPSAWPRRVTPLVMALFVAGCAAGPDYVAPAPPVNRSYGAERLHKATDSAPVSGGEAQQFSTGRDLPAEWWTLFDSEALNTLIRRALQRSPGIAGAQAALRQAQAVLEAQRAAFYPTVQAGFSPSRQKNPVGTLAPTLNSGVPVYNLATAQVSVSYAPDVFGGNRRQVESLAAQAAYQRYQLEAAYLSLSSNIVVAAVQEAALRGQIVATERLISLQSEQVSLFRSQNTLGAIAVADVVAQEAALAQTQASLSQLRKQLALQRDLLAALSGSLPDELPSEIFDLDALHLPTELPLSVPADLVTQRPDVAAAAESLHAASAQVGVASANRLPQFLISGAYGGTSTQLSSLFSPGNIFWDIAGNVSQTLLDGGALHQRQLASVAAYDQAAAQYRQAVLLACQNVADVLNALQFDAEGLAAQVAAEQAASKSLDIARDALKAGAVSYLALITAEQTYQQASINVVQARANRLSDTAALYAALGGGWWNRPAPVSSSGGGAPVLR